MRMNTGEFTRFCAISEIIAYCGHMRIPAYLLRNLRDVLSALYTDSDAIGRVAFDAGIDLVRVRLDQAPADAWHAVVLEAQRQGRVRDLAEAALHEFPTDSPLGQTLWEIRQALLALEAPPRVGEKNGLHAP